MNQDKVLITAPGKVILFGEHSVVYGKTALALSLDLRTSVVLEKQNDCVLLDLPNIEVSKAWSLSDIKKLFSKLAKHNGPFEPNAETCEKASVIFEFLHIPKNDTKKENLGLIAFFHLYSSILTKALPFSIRLESQIPTGAGLGSSAAYSVGLCTAFLLVSGQLKSAHKNGVTNLSDKDLQLISDWAMKSEKIFHGNPSGLDSAVCSYGGAIKLTNGRPSRVQTPNIQIILVNTRVSRSTKDQVQKVRQLYETDQERTIDILSSMDELADTGISCLDAIKEENMETAEDYETLLSLISCNHGFLQTLGVSHPKLDEMVDIAKRYGFHGKLTGAGGGGFGFILAPKPKFQEIELCLTELKSKGFDAWLTTLGHAGVVISSHR